MSTRRWWHRIASVYSARANTRPIRSLAPTRSKLSLEHLEARDVPAVQLVSGAFTDPINTTANEVSQIFPPGQVSDDGNWVVYTSVATNLVSGQTDTNSVRDVFLYNAQTGVNTLVSRSVVSATTTANGESLVPYISGDGNWIAFFSNATNLINGLTIPSTTYQLYLYSRTGGTLTLVSHTATSNVTGVTNDDIPQIGQLALSDDGRYIAYINDTYDLVAGYTTSDTFHPPFFLPSDAYLYDRTTNSNVLVSHTATSLTTGGNDWTTLVTISGDGSTVVFSGSATNHLTGQTDAVQTLDIFRYNVSTRAIALVTHSPTSATTAAGAAQDRDFFPASVSDNGTRIAYASFSTNLVAGQVDTGGFFPTQDIFMYNSATDTNIMVSRKFGTVATSDSSFLSGLSGSAPVISGDGNYVAFASDANELLPSPISVLLDNIYLFNVATGTNALVSHTTGSTTTATGGSSPSISGDGSLVVFTGVNAAGTLPAIVKYTRSDASVTTVGALADTGSGTGPALLGVISRDGSTIVFNSVATTLVTNDANARQDVFIDRTVTSPPPPPQNQQPTITISPQLQGSEGQPIQFQMTVTASPGTVVQTIQISGLPTGTQLSAGTFQNGVWTLTPAQLQGLTMTVPDNVQFQMQIVATAVPLVGTGTFTQTVFVAVTVANVVPTISITAPSVFNPSSPVTIGLAVTDSGSDIIQTVRINWGDGVVQTFTGLQSQYTHLYPLADSRYQIQVTVTDEDGSYTATTTVDAELLTTEEAVVAELYQDLLGRNVDPSGLASWSAKLVAGVPLKEVIRGIVNSPEYQAKVVNDLYQQYLGRNADSSGLANGLAILANGGPLDLAAMLLGSDEYFNRFGGGTKLGFLQALYLSVLGRPIDPTGQAQYSAVLDFGGSRESVADAVLNSAEGLHKIIADYYLEFLGRPGDEAGIQGWIPLYVRDADEFIIQFLSEAEYVRRLATV